MGCTIMLNESAKEWVAELIGKLIGKLFIILRFLKARKQVVRLYARSNGVSKVLLGALKTTLQFKVTPEEKEWIRKIESLRKIRI